MWSLLLLLLLLIQLAVYTRSDIHGKTHSMIVTETDTEEEILFETSSKKKGDKQERQSLIPKNNKNTPSSSSSGVKIMHNDLSNSSRNVKNTNL